KDDVSRENSDLEPLMPVAVRLSDFQKVGNGGVGCAVAAPLMGEALPKQRSCFLVIPGLAKVRKQSGNVPVAKRAVQLFPERIRQLQHQENLCARPGAQVDRTQAARPADLSRRRR